MADMRGEPTMEEILASIRRIIAEDPAPIAHGQSGRKSAAGRPQRIARPTDEPAASAGEDESETEGSFKAHLEAASESLDAAPRSDSVSDESAEPQDPADSDAPSDDEVLELTEIAGAAADHEDPMILSAATASVTAERLQRASDMMMQHPETGSPTVEALVREMLRPMLKHWLDANLPDIVDQVVSREIARLTGRPR